MSSSILGLASKPYKNVLVVVKTTPFQYYTQLRAQGKAPSALRWSRLKSRHDSHWACVSNVKSILEKVGCTHNVIEREEMHRGLLDDKDLVITVGGDGTVLNAASFVTSDIPVLGINSDPTPPEEMGAQKKVDERRSRGALCATTAQDVDELLPLMVTGDIAPRPRSRLMCVVQSTHTETRLPPVLNDILIAHPIPAQVSRFRMTCYHDTKFYKHKESFYDHRASAEDMKTLFSFNAWCSGMWICTATGSSAAMAAAGGSPMDVRAKSLQYMVRENMREYGQESIKAAGSGIIASDQLMALRWNSLEGRVFVDGSHMEFSLQLGDEVVVNSHAPPLNLFDPPDFEDHLSL